MRTAAALLLRRLLPILALGERARAALKKMNSEDSPSLTLLRSRLLEGRAL